MIGYLVAAAISASGMLVLQPGETVVFHLVDGRPVIDVGASTVSPPVGSLIATLNVGVAGGAPGTTLKIVNGTSDWLNYKAAIDVGGRGGPTSVCTLMNNGRVGFEQWPEQLRAVAIGKFKPAPIDKMTCQ